MTGNSPRNHHYVPQHFLKAWEASRGKVFRYRRIPATGKLEVRQSAIRKTASEDNLYQLSFEDGAFEIESSIVTPKVDELGHKILEASRMRSILGLNLNERRQLANYITCLEARHPEILEAMDMRGRLDELRQNMKSEGFANEKSIDEVIDYFKSSDGLGAFAFGYFAQNESNPLLARPFSDGLMRAHVREYTFSGRPLLSSNYPVVRWGDYLSDVFCVISISPSKAVVYSTNGDVDAFDSVPSLTRARLINLYTIRKADQAYFYDDSLASFVDTHLSWGKAHPSLPEQKEYIGSFIRQELAAHQSQV